MFINTWKTNQVTQYVYNIKTNDANSKLSTFKLRIKTNILNFEYGQAELY
jgi:hypothetical protein